MGPGAGATGDATRGEILDAALKAFAEAGFGAMSVRGLTRQLGASHNPVHHHFGSKQDLWRMALRSPASSRRNPLARAGALIISTKNTLCSVA